MVVELAELGLAAAACLAVGSLAALRLAGATPAERTSRLLLPLLLGAVAVTAWAAFRLLPHWNWSAARLAASVRIAEGLPLYRGPGDPAVNGWIYGPVGALAYLPATLAAEPLAALRIATWLNAAYFLLPAALLFGPWLRQRRTRAAGLLLCAFAVAALLAPFGTWYGAAALNTDVVAVALGTGSCIALVRLRHPAWAAGLAVAAAWTKQVEVLVGAAQLGFLLRVHGRPAALAYLRWYAGAAVAAAAIFVGWFGAGPLWHCLVTIPAGHPVALARIGPMLAAFAAGTAWVWVTVLLIRPGRRPDVAAPAAEDRLGPLLLTVALAVLPLGAMAAAKTGGDENSLHSIAYAALGGTVLLAGELRAAGRRRDLVLLALTLGSLGAAAFGLQRAVRQGHLAIAEPGAQHREAFAFALEHRGAAAFPNNPLIVLLAEGRDDPFDYGLFDWRLAGRPVDRAEIRRQFPAALAFLVYHEKDPSRELRHVFTEFTRVYQIGPWDIFTRPPGGEAGRAPAP